MSLNLPRAPNPDLFRTDPTAYIRALSEYQNKLGQELERFSRQQETPAKAVFLVTGIAAPTTTLDGGTAVLGDVINFLGGLYATLLAKGIIRSKAGAE